MSGLSREVTVVVPARGRPHLTAFLLQSLRETRSGCRVILVDDGTPDPLSRQLPRYPGLDIEIIRNDETVGPAASRNIGTQHAHSEFVAFTDNDVRVLPEWLPKLHSHMRSAPADVAGVGGRVADDGSSLVGRYATQLRLLDPYMYRGRAAYLVTANCVFRRGALMRVGGFDESFTTPGGEDPELSFRLLRAGFRLEYEPDAVVVHHYDRSWLAFCRLFSRYGRGCRKAMATLET